MIKRKGIILAGGSGTRLYPLTIGISKQLLPVYDKPMIYYPLSVLMLAGIREILVITTPIDAPQFKRVLGDGTQWGIQLSYKVQPTPDGLAQAYIIAEKFLNGEPSALILGDNIFFGHGLPELLASANEKQIGATIFGYHVVDPEKYGVVGFNELGNVNSIVEKAKVPASNYAITGLYFIDSDAPERAKQIKPSKRGELEITSLLETYLIEDSLLFKKMGRGFAWLDTGTHESLLDASNLVKTLTQRQGLQVGSPDEISFRYNWIDEDRLLATSYRFKKTEYGNYLKNLIGDVE